MFFMWGYEGEELSDIEATYEHVKACRPDVFFTTVSYPIKGTPYYDEVAPKLVQLGAWQATTDRDIKIRGRRSRRFYQLADQLLRSETPAEAALVRQISGRRLQRGGGMRSATVFDRIAADYDALWTTTPIGRAQRNLVWREMDALFHPGERILDIGCGTGEDAAHFAARGVQVYATDASPAMVQVARARGVTATVCERRRTRANRQIVRWRDLEFRRAELRGESSGRGRFAGRTGAPGRPRGHLPAGAILRVGDSVLRVCASSGARLSGVGGAAARYREIDGPLPDGSGNSRRICARLRIARWTGIGLLVPPSYVKLPAAWSACLPRATASWRACRSCARWRTTAYSSW